MRGIWTFDYIIYKNHNIINCISINSFDFSDNLNVNVPGTYPNCDSLQSSYGGDGNYEIIQKENKVYIKIKCRNSLFEDYYKLKFYKGNEPGLLMAILESNDIKIVMRKSVYPNNKNYIKNLIKLTN